MNYIKKIQNLDFQNYTGLNDYKIWLLSKKFANFTKKIYNNNLKL